MKTPSSPNACSDCYLFREIKLQETLRKQLLQYFSIFFFLLKLRQTLYISPEEPGDGCIDFQVSLSSFHISNTVLDPWATEVNRAQSQDMGSSLTKEECRCVLQETPSKRGHDKYQIQGSDKGRGGRHEQVVSVCHHSYLWLSALRERSATQAGLLTSKHRPWVSLSLVGSTKDSEHWVRVFVWKLTQRNRHNLATLDSFLLCILPSEVRQEEWQSHSPAFASWRPSHQQ